MIKIIKLLFSITTFFLVSITLFFTWFYYSDFNDKDIVLVGLLDTGVDYTHPYFQGRIINGADFLDLDFDSMDSSGHGTHMASSIIKHTKDTKILSVRMINGKIHEIVGIIYAVIKGSDIINMSFENSYSPLTEFVIRLSDKKGVIFVGAAGNHSKPELTYPSKYKEVISVGSVNPNNNYISTISNYGDDVDYYVPGDNINGAGLNGTFLKLSGTSISTSQLTGSIAYLMEQGYEKKDILTILDSSSIPTQEFLRDKHIRYSIIDPTYLHDLLHNEPHLWIKYNLNLNKKTADFQFNIVDSIRIMIFHDGDLIYNQLVSNTLHLELPINKSNNVFSIYSISGKKITKKDIHIFSDER